MHIFMNKSIETMSIHGLLYVDLDRLMHQMADLISENPRTQHLIKFIAVRYWNPLFSDNSLYLMITCMHGLMVSCIPPQAHIHIHNYMYTLTNIHVKPDLTFFSEIDYKGHFLVKCLRQDVEEDLHLQRTGRTDPMEASKHIVLALETSFPRPYAAAHVEIYAQVCVSMCSILGYRDYENKLTINST